LFKEAPAFSSQEFLMKLAEGKTDIAAIPVVNATKGPKKSAQRSPKPMARDLQAIS